MVLLKCTFLLVLICHFAEPANILGIFPTPAASHFTLGFRLMKELADRGHNVTVVNPFPQKEPISNYTDVSVETMANVLAGFKKDFYDRESMSFRRSVKFLHNMAYELTHALLAHENFQSLLKSETKFDVIIAEYFMNEALLGVGHIFNAPVVLFSTLPSSALTNHLFANPAPSSYVPYILSSYTGKMDLWQRLSNLAYNAYDTLYKQYHMLPLHDALLKRYISEKLNIEEVKSNASLMLLNSHPSVSEPVPHTPNMIEIGGFHISPPKNLSLELKTFMDDAEDGVVVFSMGSNLKSSDLSENKRIAIAKAFSRIKQRVLWKFEDEDFPGLTENVKIVKWLPQQDILRHSNTKAFITHGGMLSSIEAVYFGVPVIGIPIYGDQKMNIAKAVQSGYAVSIPFNELDEENLLSALNVVVYEEKYAKQAKFLSQAINNQPMNPLDLAVFWVESVISLKGAPYLKSPGVELKWYQISMLDLIIILTLADIILFLIFYYIIKHIIHYIIKRIRNSPSKKYERLGKNAKK
uniref:UDP-glucuronosyltransferase n=1 Tax=Xylotrechus quadripes TaxID=554073 RepID=A0A6G7SFF1_9CUCU|nr:UDP-glycosyltransferase [Xylotrechus quadripes]